MAELLFLSRTDVESLLDLDELLEALEDGLRRLSDGTASVPPRAGAEAPGGLLLAMPGSVPDLALVTKLVSVFPGNHEHGLPSHFALIVALDPETGQPLAVMDGTHVTAVRTAATSALAWRAVGRPDARVLAILGAGVQGGSHLDAFDHVGAFSEVRVASRTHDHAVALAEQHPRARAVATFEEAVRGADVVCCCTDSRDPVIRREWLAPAAHVSSVGTGEEVDGATIDAASVFVEWRGAVTNAPPAGAVELQGRDPESVTEIGEVLAGTRPGRRSDDEVTVWKSTGHAVEDAAAAALVLRRATGEGRGTVLTLD
ncbi:MAG: ornithine cyclodeaminase family protein [Nitriliruptorales bacterium]